MEKPSLRIFQAEYGLPSDTINTKMSSRVKSFWDLLAWLAAFLNDEILIEFWTLNGLNNFLAFS